MSISDYTGQIVEFLDAPISFIIQVPGNAETAFKLKVGPSTIPNVYNILWNKHVIGATHRQAKEHILLALEIAKISTYSSTHQIMLHVPSLPNLIIPVTDLERAIDIVKKAIDMYF